MNAIANKALEAVHNTLGMFYFAGYLLLISPPRAIDLTVSQREQQGELSRWPLFSVMLVELSIRIALILLVAAGLELAIGELVYETYLFDVFFGVLVALGSVHSLFYLLLLGYLPAYSGRAVALRLYRLARNLCYAAIPGFAVVAPLLLWKPHRGQQPFDDGLVFVVYLLTSLLMVALGVFEAMLVRRRPLGLGEHP